jgi:hypothetical protein
LNLISHEHVLSHAGTRYAALRYTVLHCRYAFILDTPEGPTESGTFLVSGEGSRNELHDRDAEMGVFA